MVSVKGNVNSTISSLTQLGLTENQIRVTFHYNKEPLHVNAWGPAPVIVDKQVFPAFALIMLDLIHYDPVVLAECQRLSNAAPGEGILGAAGLRMGNNGLRFAATNDYIGLNLISGLGLGTWRFLYTDLIDSLEIPLGTQKAIVRCTFQAVPYTNDPWQGGLGSFGTVWYDHLTDT